MPRTPFVVTFAIVPAALAALAVLALLPGGAHAEPAGHSRHGAHSPPAGQNSPGSPGPYAGWQARAVKSLSGDDLADLRAGRGMSLALSTELNGYPGPTHVLELASHLGLSHAQRAETEAMLAEMKDAATRLGAELIEAERAVDAVFKGRAAEPVLAKAVERAAAVRGQLRLVHLRYHLKMMAVLTPEQVAAYNRMRGYL